MSCVDVVLYNRASLSVLGEQLSVLASAWVVWGSPREDMSLLSSVFKEQMGAKGNHLECSTLSDLSVIL